MIIERLTTEALPRRGRGRGRPVVIVRERERGRELREIGIETGKGVVLQTSEYYVRRSAFVEITRHRYV